MKKIRKILAKEVKYAVRDLLRGGLTVFVLGVLTAYYFVAMPQQTELNQYRAAAFWVNFNNQNPDFGLPIGAAWKGTDYVVVYPTGYRLVVPVTGETYALRPDGTRVPHRFSIYPPADVRRTNLEGVVKYWR